MSKWNFLATLLSSAALLAAPGAVATVNYGDFLGTDVDFLQVSETTTSVGDPEPLLEAPTLGGTGTQLLFSPSAFVSSCIGPSTSDTTSTNLTTTIAAQTGVHIETISLMAAGDTTLLQFPPFGDASTNSAVTLSGTATVTETTSGPIAPVMIPFSGVFTPGDTFSLPGNFGTSNWSGSIDVDVISSVALATVVELSLDNALDTNCGVGLGVPPTALMQNKDLSGPTVALLVNPLECELAIDKTCCVTQPVLPDLGQCEGQMVSMTMEYTGGSCRRSNNDQGRSFRCHGRREVGEPVDITPFDWQGLVRATPSQGVTIGQEVVFTSTTDIMPTKTKIKIEDDWSRKQYLKINTSCQKAFQCDDQFGALKVVGFESTVGGLVDCGAPPPPPVCSVSGDPIGTPCDAKLIDMVLEYNGQACQTPLGNPQNGEAVCSGDATGATNVNLLYTGNHPDRQMTSPSSGINDGDLVRVTATWNSGLFPNQKFLITDSGGVLQSVDFHVSCSQPLALGDEFGSLKLVEFTTKNGTQVGLGAGGDPADSCEVPLAPPGPHCTSTLDELSLVYIGDLLGEGCTVSNPQGGFATCTGVDDPGEPVDLSITFGLQIEPNEDVEFGDIITISNAWGNYLPSSVSFDATGSGGTQALGIKTSCSKPLSLGDRFGAFVVYGMDRVDEGPITLGGEIQYQYAVTNPGVDAIGNVSIDDDQLGNIVSGETLAGGETKTFTQNATLLGTTTNVATATGDIDGDVCDPGLDSVTVTVSAPPQGSFSCSKPITELTLVWNGAQTVDVKVYEGRPSRNVLLSTFEDVVPGEVITADGLGAGSKVYFEILTSDGLTLLGESKFDLFCNDHHMNGLEDCGKNLGNGKSDHTNFINDWLLEGMVDSDETLACTPGVVGAPPDCGFGPELMVVLPGLMWMHRRRMRRRK